MPTMGEVHSYNAELMDFLNEVWSFVPQGRRKQLVKQSRIRALLDRYGIEWNE